MLRLHRQLKQDYRQPNQSRLRCNPNDMITSTKDLQNRKTLPQVEYANDEACKYPNCENRNAQVPSQCWITFRQLLSQPVRHPKSRANKDDHRQDQFDRKQGGCPQINCQITLTHFSLSSRRIARCALITYVIINTGSQITDEIAAQ